MSISTIPPFSNHLPVRIRFGDGVAGELGSVGAGHGARSAGVAASVGALTAARIDVTRFVKAEGEPTIDMVDAAAQALLEVRPEAVVAIGGGSVIDTAKAARLCAQRGSTFAEFLASDRAVHEPTVPLIALP